MDAFTFAIIADDTFQFAVTSKTHAAYSHYAIIYTEWLPNRFAQDRSEYYHTYIITDLDQCSTDCPALLCVFLPC